MTEQHGDSHATAVSRPSPSEWLGAHKHPQLLPTPWLTDEGLEDFVEALLLSERLLGVAVRHVQHVERWGVSGDKQDGIDFFGQFNDGTTAAWQVKQLEKLTRGDVRAAVKAATFERADELYLVFGGIATVQAREEMLLHPRWTLLDRRTLTETLRLLPSQTQRGIIDRFWGPEVRRHFVSAPGDAMVPFDQFRKSRQNPDALINDLGELAGRDDELDRFTRALSREVTESPQIIVVSGPGGRGKTRLLIEALTLEAMRQPNRVISCLAPMRVFDAAAMNEIPQNEGIVAIDDAHIDPAALEPLLALARSNPDLQVVLASRPSGLGMVQEAITRASFGPREHEVISVGELNLKSAIELVKGLITNLELGFGLRNYLAEQARHSPHVAVILTNLIRTGQISGSLLVNEDLRRTVLARYRELMVPGQIDGFDTDVVQRVIATYACVQPDSPLDKRVQARIAHFCGLPVIQLARLTRRLIDQGLILDQDNRLRVVPDLLSDQIVESVAVFEQYDTGFVSDLWHEFGPTHYERLALTLGELDWRIGHRDGPSVMAPVWDVVRERLNSPYPWALCRELDQIAPLAATQPKALVAVLEALRERLDLEDAAGTPVPEDPEDEEDRLYRRVWPYSRKVDRSEVRAKLPRLYGRAAVNDPTTIETAVDALLALARADTRAPNAHPGHARRVLTDELSNLATLSDPATPLRIVTRVRVHCETGTDDEALAALSALKPLLAKEELETIQSALYQLSFRSHLISAAAMRPVRDHIRQLLKNEGASDQVARAGAAVDLLREALRAPRGHFGRDVSADAVLAWEGDDLETVRSLADIAARTHFATVRRMVRETVDWSAEHAESLPLRHASLSLQFELDRSEDIRDALADRIIGSPWKIAGELINRVPGLDELQSDRDAGRRELEELSEEQKRDARQVKFTAKAESRRTRIPAVDGALARRLLEYGDASQIVHLLTQLSAEARQLGKQPTFRGVWQSLSAIRPGLVPELVNIIAGQADESPLDHDLPALLAHWNMHTPGDALGWAGDAVKSGRSGVRLAIGFFVDDMPWTAHQAEFSSIWRAGIADQDELVAARFLGSAGWYLHSNPIEAAAVLLENEISPPAAGASLMGAWRYGESPESPPLDRTAQEAMLSIASRAGFDDFIAQETLTNAAREHPDLGLDQLLELSRNGESVPDGIHDLAAVFENRSTAFTEWLLDHLHEELASIEEVVSAALNGYLPTSIAESLTRRVPDLSTGDLLALVRVLGSLPMWIPNNLNLAEACVELSENRNLLDEIVPELRRGVSLRGWGWIGNESSELNNARDVCTAAAERTTSTQLRAQLIEATEWFQTTIGDLRLRERDEDW